MKNEKCVSHHVQDLVAFQLLWFKHIVFVKYNKLEWDNSFPNS